MRIWDLDPGFLNDQSLLGEHREIHGLFSIHVNKKTGYANHPETRRWKNALSGLAVRHGLLVCEMQLRGFNHKSPLASVSDDSRSPVDWPGTVIDTPERQFRLLKEKYQNKPQGRIPLAANLFALWASHKYSVMARDPELYRALGPRVAKKEISFQDLSRLLVQTLRKAPDPRRLVNALDHMWGYVSGVSPIPRKDLDPPALLKEIQRLTLAGRADYLLHSTAIGELEFWISPKNNFSVSIQRDGD